MSKKVKIDEIEIFLKMITLKERIRAREKFFDACVLNGVPERGLKSAKEAFLLRIEKIIEDHCE